MCFGKHPFIEIDEELRRLIPARSKEEDEQLEANILAEGEIREAVVLWGNIVIDGMGRLKVARKHDLPFRIVRKEFRDNAECKAWMYSNQLGRRNLTDKQIAVMRGDLYNIQKDDKGGDRKSKVQNEPLIAQDATAQQLAKTFGTGASTIKRDGELAESVAKLAPDVATAVVDHKVKANRAAVAELATKTPAQQRKVVAAVQSGKAKSVQEVLKPKQNGKPTGWQGDKIVEGHYGKLVRSLDEKAAAVGKGKHHKLCLESLSQFLGHWNDWKAAKA